MRVEGFDTVVVSWTADGDTVVSRQSNELAARLPGVFAITTLACLVAGPQILLAGYALVSPAVRDTIIQNPMLAVQFAVALCFWAALVIWPLRRALGRLGRQRTVTIHGRSVTIDDISPFARVTKASALGGFSGIAHHIRSSMGTPRHELVLVHPEPRASILLAASEHISERELQMWQQRLGLPLRPARDIYRRHAIPSSTDEPTAATLSDQAVGAMASAA
jgi:hypothetical protein